MADQAPTPAAAAAARDARRGGPNKTIAYATRGVVAVMLVGLGIGVAQALVANKPQVQTRAQSRGLPTVRVIEVMRRPVARQWQGYGTVRALDSADVPARISATVVAVPEGIDAGRAVRRGDVLARLDPSDFQREVQAAANNLDDLRARIAQLDVERRSLEDRLELIREEVQINQDEYERTQRIYDAKASTRRDLDQTRRAYLQSRAELARMQESFDALPARRDQLDALVAAQQARLETAQLNLERAVITSPLDGVLQAVDVEVGENLQAGSRVARVVDPTRLEVAIDLPTAALTDVGVGDPIMLRRTGPESVGSTPTATTIARVAPEADASRATFTVYAELTVDPVPRGGSASDALTPGLFVEARVTGRDKRPRMVVPRRSIRAGSVLRIEPTDDQDTGESNPTDGRGVIQSVPVQNAFVVAARLAEPLLPDDQWVVLADPTTQAGTPNADTTTTATTTDPALPIRDHDDNDDGDHADDTPTGQTRPLRVGDLILVNASSSVTDGQHVIPRRVE